MNYPFPVTLDVGYQRKVLFALELLDAVTLTRISTGVKKIVAVGLPNEKPITNASGHFVWLEQDLSRLQKITLDLGALPYETVEISAADVTLPLTTIELQPRVDYPFAVGVTGVRGTLIEDRLASRPIARAAVGLQWLDADSVTWRDAPTRSQTNSRGDFLSVLRLAPTDDPDIDADRKLTVRVRVRRDTAERTSAALKLPQGRVADPSTLNALTLAWDEL